MSKTILFTRPRHDLVTNYLYYWSGKVMGEATKKGHKVLDLSEKKAVPKEFDGRVKKMQPNLIVLNGHGNESLVCGHDDIPLLHQKNAHTAHGAVVYARSCNSASKLGEYCVAKGVAAYLGYSEKFWVCYDQDKIHHPLEDKIAAYVMEPSNQLVSSLIKGRTAAEAKTKSQEVASRMMKKLMGSNAPDGASNILACVWANKTYQVCRGNLNAKI